MQVETLHTYYLGDGAYVGLDIEGHQIWLGANHHLNMTVALGPREIVALVSWIKHNAPQFAQAMRIDTRYEE